MKARLSIFVLALILSLGASDPLDMFRDVVIQNVDRAVDLTSQLCRVETSVEIKNERDTPLNEFYFAIPAENAETLRQFLVKDRYNEAQAYDYRIIENLKIKSDYNATLYKVTLDPPLRSGQTRTLKTAEVYWGRMQPLPKKITINEDQKMTFDDSSYYFTPYTVLAQTTFYKLAGFPISYSDAEGKSRGQNLEYKFTATVGGFERKHNRIHFENNTPFVVFKEVTKTIEVSHWGNIYIEESYKLANEGAEFVGEFSRIDFNNFNRNSGKSALRGLSAKYPVHAWGMHYRDEVGNISTSRAFRDMENVNIHLAPRFAILGGWSHNWVISYNLPTSYYLFNKGNDKSSFVLKQDFGFPIENMLAEKYTLKIILPEGASNANVNLPFAVDNQYETKTFSYLDVEGRPTHVIQKNNVLDYHFKQFDVTYKFDTKNIFIEGGLLFGFFLFVFALAIIIGRIDFSFKHKSA